MNVVSGMQVGNGVVRDAEVGRGHASLEAIAGEYHFPRPASTLCAGHVSAEDQFPKDVRSQLHHVFLYSR